MAHYRCEECGLGSYLVFVQDITRIICANCGTQDMKFDQVERA